MGIQRVYSRATPYPATSLPAIDWAQTSDIMYTVHTGYPVQKLERHGHIDWRWLEVEFGPIESPPTGMSATPSMPNVTGAHAQDYSYVITGIVDNGSDPVQETRASAVFTANNDLSLAGNYNTINLPALGAFARFVIYKKQAGVFGYIGNTAEATFRDENIVPALSETPPEGYNPFNAAGAYPSSLTLHQQRLCLAGTLNVINGCWLSRSADFENMDRARPIRPDDSISFALVADRVNAITHILSLKELIVLTGDGLWAVGGGGETGAAITPGTIVASRETGRGSARVKPLVVDDIMFYVTGKGRTVRTLGFTFEIDGYKSDNVSIFAPHLFEDGVRRIVYVEEPHACVYVLRADGTLIALTWEIDHDVWGWSRLEIDGTVEDICVITEGEYDRLYAVIRRTIGGVEQRNLERMALPGDVENGCHLDFSSTFVFEEGAEDDTVTGLWHLDGQQVSVAYDGYVQHDVTVEDGQIVAPEPANLISVGLRYEGLIETLPPPLNTSGGTMHVERQQVTDVVIRMHDTKGISAGINGQELEQFEPESGDDVSLDPNYEMTDWYVNVPGDWKDNTTLLIKQTEPFPANIISIFSAMRISP